MTNNVENLILDLVEWVGRKDRTYRETMDAWRTSCPRAGLAFLKEHRPHVHEELQDRNGR